MAKSVFFLSIGLLATGLLMADLALAEGVVSQMSGDVEIGRGEPPQWSSANSGDVIGSNDRVRTGADGRVEIKMDAGTLRVNENSMLRLPPPANDADQVELEKGRSLFDVLRRGGRRFEVHTPTVVVSVKGTRFGVDAGTDVGEVTVYRGTVGVREVGAAEMMETLVREGFLATGGVGMPVELDVSTTVDPWQRWQAFDRADLDEHRIQNRMGEMDRAKAALHRATAADVIVKAAERKPEVAKRLKAIQQKQRADSRKKAKGSDVSEQPMPASPDFDGENGADHKRGVMREHLGSKARTMQQQEMQLKVMDAKQVMDASSAEEEMVFEESMKMEDLSGQTGTLQNSIEFDYAAVYELSPSALLVVRSTLLDLQAQYEVGTFTPTDPSDLVTELERSLITQGFTAAEAFKVVQTLLGN
jgi:hypothetical protein